jgi:membrane associated rhomboid family serine protease
MSAVLIGVNLAVFVAVNVGGRLMDVLALPPDWAGVVEQPWTVLTVFFIAEVLIHIFAAVFIIGVFGAWFERIAGSRQVLGVYLLAGLALQGHWLWSQPPVSRGSPSPRTAHRRRSSAWLGR